MRNRQSCFLLCHSVANRHARALLCKALCLLLVAVLRERSSQMLRRLLSLPKNRWMFLSRIKLYLGGALEMWQVVFGSAPSLCSFWSDGAIFKIDFVSNNDELKEPIVSIQQFSNKPESCRGHVGMPGSETHPSTIPKIWMCLELLYHRRAHNSLLRGKMQLRVTVNWNWESLVGQYYNTWNLSWPAVSQIWRVTMRSSTRTSFVKKSAPIVA